MKSMLILIVCTLLASASAIASSTEKEDRLIRLTLDECIARAVASSNALRAERERLEAFDAQIKQLYWEPFTNVFVEGFATMVPDKCINKQLLEDEGRIEACNNDTLDDFDYKDKHWGPKLSYRAGFKLPIYTFGKLTHGAKAAKAAEKAKEAELPRFMHTVRYQVEQAYNAVSGAREMLYTIGKGREYLKKARDKIEEDLENQNGDATQIDLIKIKVFEGEVAQYEAQALEIERVGLAALRMLVGGDDKSRVDIEDKPQERDARELTSLEKYKDDALSRRPELKAIQHAVRALEAKVEFRKAEFWPDIYIAGGIVGARTPGRTDIESGVLSDDYNYGPGWGVGIGLRYTFDIGLDIYKLKQAKAELAALTTDQRAALDGIMLEVEKAYHHVTSVKESLDALEESKKLVKGWISAVLQNHAIGLAAAKDVKEALKEYFKVMASLHKATHDYNVGMAELDRVTGAPFAEKRD
jgi:outer membrane protein